MRLPVDSLLKLPEGAAYRESNQRAHVEATQKGGVIYITGTCDSLQRRAEYYENLYHTARDALEESGNRQIQEQSKRSDPLSHPIAMFVMGLAAGILITLTILIYKRHGKE